MVPKDNTATDGPVVNIEALAAATTPEEVLAATTVPWLCTDDGRTNGNAEHAR